MGVVGFLGLTEGNVCMGERPDDRLLDRESLCIGDRTLGVLDCESERERFLAHTESVSITKDIHETDITYERTYLGDMSRDISRGRSFVTDEIQLARDTREARKLGETVPRRCFLKDIPYGIEINLEKEDITLVYTPC